MCTIFLMVLTFMYLVNVKTMRKIAQIFVASSEKLNFNASLPFQRFDMRGLLTFKIENFGPTLKLIYNFNIIIKKQPVKK